MIQITRALFININGQTFAIAESDAWDLRRELDVALGVLPVNEPVADRAHCTNCKVSFNRAASPGGNRCGPLCRTCWECEEYNAKIAEPPIPPIPDDPRSFEEIHAEESAVPLADEALPVKSAGPNLDPKTTQEPGSQSTADTTPEPDGGPKVVQTRKDSDFQEFEFELEPWEEKLLELWHKVRGKYPHEPDSTVAGRVYIYTCRHKDPNLNRLYTADIRRELRRLGIDIADPRSCAPKSRPGPKPESVTPPPPTSSEPVADSPPAPASGQPFDVADGIVQLWHRYRPMFAKDAGVISRIMQVTRSPKWGGIKTPEIRAILREQGIHVEEPAKNQHDSKLSEDVLPRSTCPPDVSAEAPDHVHIPEAAPRSLKPWDKPYSPGQALQAVAVLKQKSGSIAAAANKSGLTVQQVYAIKHLAGWTQAEIDELADEWRAMERMGRAA